MARNRDLIDILNQQREDHSQEFLDTEVKGSGNLLWDFTGQALWGAFEQVGIGLPGAADAYYEHSYGKANAPTWERAIAGDAAGDWNELSDAGKAGYMIGSAVGMIPSFWYGGAMAGKTITGLGQIGGRAASWATSKSTQELIEAGTKYAGREGLESIGDLLTKKVSIEGVEKGLASHIIDDAYEISSAANSFGSAERAIAGEFIENVMEDGVKRNLDEFVQLGDDALTSELSKEVVKIVSRNNPMNAMEVMNNFVSRIPGIRNLGPNNHYILGAMGYDAAIGVAMGTIRTASEGISKATWGVERNKNTGEMEYSGDYDINPGELGASWVSHGLQEALFFSILGPVKFIKGGTQGDHLNRLNRIVKQSAKAYYKPLRDYKNSELRAQLTAMHEISGGWLSSRLSNKWSLKPVKWWESATDKAGTLEMQKFLSEIRGTYVTRAPLEWTKEFGSDMFYSLPRMFTGVMAMNSMGIYDAFKNNGMSWESFSMAMGGSVEEQIANVMTAAYFTRKPHSFHTEAPPALFKSIWQGGEIPAYYGAKTSKLRKIIGSLETFGVDKSRLKVLSAHFGDSQHSELSSKVNDNVIKKSIDTTKEFKEIEEVFKPYVDQEVAGGVDLKTAFDKNVSELLKNGDITVDEAGILQGKLFIAEKILSEYNGNRGSDKLGLDMYTPQQAYDIVLKVSNMNFNGKKLTRLNADAEIRDWRKKAIIKTIEEPTNIMKNLIIDTYKALDINYDFSDGVITGPELNKIQHHLGDNNVQTTFATVYDWGVKNNWIKQRTGAPEGITGEQQTKAQNIWRSSSERLMDLTYGENWRNEREFDDFILVNDAWHLTYDSALKLHQRERTHELLTHGVNHGGRPDQARKLMTKIQQLIVNKTRPEVLKPGETAPENFGEVTDFINKLHSVMMDLNVDVSRDRKNASITYEEASGMMESVREIVGDVFTNAEVYKEFKRDIIERSIDKLGISDIHTGVDTKASLITFLKDTNINYQSEGTKDILPDIASVKNALNTMGTKISPDTKELLIKHYTQVINAVERSRFPLEIRKDLIETTEGDWMKAILQSKAAGEMALDYLINDRARLNMDILKNEIDKMDLIIGSLQRGEANIAEPNLKTRAEKQLRDRLQERKITNELKEMIKTALEDRDVYTLRALNRVDGEIHSLVEMLSRDSWGTERIGYLQKVALLMEKAENKAQKLALNESTIREFVQGELNKYNISEKDVTDNIIKMNVNMFSNKYKIPKLELDELFELDRSSVKTADEIRQFAQSMLGDFYDLPGSVQNIALRNNITTAVNTLKKLSGDIRLTPENFTNLIANPLKLKMQAENLSRDPLERSSALEIDSDHYSLTSNYFSKRVVKTLKLDLRNNRLIMGSQVVGDTANRGLTGILNKLDPTQRFIYLAESSGVDSDGKVIRNVINRELDTYNTSLKGGRFNIYNPEARREYRDTGDINKLKDQNIDRPLVKEQFEIIPINEKTALFVRVDKYDPSSIFNEIRSQYNPGGEMYKKLEAVYDGDLGKNTPKHLAIRDILENVRGGESVETVAEAVKLTRMLLNMPGEIPNVIESGKIRLDHDMIADLHKRDNLAETKNGFIPTDANREKANLIYRNAESELFQNVHKEIESWLTKNADGEYRKIKNISIDDEMSFDDGLNIFDALAREKVRLKLLRGTGKISKEDYDLNVSMQEKVSKSIVDGGTFVAKDLYLSQLSLIGLHPDMVITNANNEVVGFKSGAIKPTIAHSDVNLETGRIEQWFGKTSIQYDPLLESLFTKLKVDMITFKSANKINKVKDGFGEELKNNFAEINPTTSDRELSRPWYEYISNNIVDKNIISEIPFEAFSLRTVSREHDPLVGSNLGVHMSRDTGLADWMKLDAKIVNYKNNLAQMYQDAFHRTALAQQVMGAMTKTGDPTMVNSAMNSILTRDGIVIEPWAQRKLEDNMINYFINNGNIAAGIVKDGSVDVMRADTGVLQGTIRSRIGEKNVVQYFGEFLPSYYAAQKIFKRTPDIDGVQNVLIQEIKYISEAGRRNADAFITDIDGVKFLQVEGRYIDKDGNLVNPDTFEVIKSSSSISDKNMINDNKIAFDSAIKKQERALDLKDQNGDLLIGDFTTLADAAWVLKPLGLSIGMLNSRQPRNMIGDVVISKMAMVDGKFHVDENSGNVSRMNAVDAIKPQDADFDMDKSFNYIAAPGKFWREASKIAGDIVGAQENPKDVIDRLFDPNLRDGDFAKVVTEMIGRGSDKEQVMNEASDARGRFVKMHQVATYISNIFKESTTILDFTTKSTLDGNKNFQVRLSGDGKYINVVNNISKMATEFIDIYKQLPSLHSIDKIRERQEQILFGKNGIFEIGYESSKKGEIGKFISVSEYNLKDPRFSDAMNAIKTRLIDPINLYLKFNKGVSVDDVGNQNRATLSDYSEAYRNLFNKSLDPSKDWGISESVDFRAGLIAAQTYFSTSRNPYDLAMRSMNDIYGKTVKLKEQGSYGKGFSEYDTIKQYIEGGFENVVGATPEQKHNKVFNSALREFVKDESRIIKLEELRKSEKSYKIQLETLKNYYKNTATTTEMESIQRKLLRTQEVIEMMEESISYHFRDKDPTRPPTPVFHKGYRQGDFNNIYNKPVVIVDSKGDIREVVRVGNYNINPVKRSDKILINGRRYQVADGQEQQGLRTLFEAFAGNPAVRDEHGNIYRYSTYEVQNHIMKDLNVLRSRLITLKDSMNLKNKQDWADYSLEREAILHDFLFNTIEDPMYRKAMIMRMLTPEVSDKIVSIRSINAINNRRAVYDYMYYENGLSQPVMSLLAKLASGETQPKSGLKEFASKALDEINIIKNAAYLSTKNSKIDIEQITTSMFTEPASLNGFLTSSKLLNQGVFEQRNATEKNVRDAAQILVEYATGQRGELIDPVILYKASKVMEEKNIRPDQMWGVETYQTNPDGSIRDFGARKLLISERSSIRRKKLGEKGGNEISTTNRIKQISDCYLEGK